MQSSSLANHPKARERKGEVRFYLVTGNAAAQRTEREQLLISLSFREGF